jgi:oligopeptide/dipeptide ABC transporter ATP-binding protein
VSALVSCVNLVKEFPGPAAVLRRAAAVPAVQDVSLAVSRGETLALVGESGSGKTTLGRCLLRLLEPTAGRVTFDGADVLALSPRELRRWRRRAQFVFQDPAAALNPRMTIGRAIREPLLAHGLAPGSDVADRVAAALTEVGLDPSHARRFPHELSGGQQQRAVIARALILAPEFVVLDEPVASLDVSVAAQVLNLLADLQEQRRLTYLLIAHDLRVVRHFADRVAVMYAGRLVEVAPTDPLYADPRHPYTAALLSAVPVLDAGVRRERVPLPGDPPSAPVSLPGCPFAPRCRHPRKNDRCVQERPLLREVSPARLAACHHADHPGPDAATP